MDWHRTYCRVGNNETFVLHCTRQVKCSFCNVIIALNCDRLYRTSYKWIVWSFIHLIYFEIWMATMGRMAGCNLLSIDRSRGSEPISLTNTLKLKTTVSSSHLDHYFSRTIVSIDNCRTFNCKSQVHFSTWDECIILIAKYDGSCDVLCMLWIMADSHNLFLLVADMPQKENQQTLRCTYHWTYPY